VAVHIAHLVRSARGDVINACRLISERSEQSWSAPSYTPDASVTHDTEAAADWLAAQIRARGSRLDVLCLDTDGGIGAFLTSPSSDPAIVAAVALQKAMPTGSGGVTPLGEYAPSPDAAAVALLGEPEAPTEPASKPTGVKTPSKPRRLAVLAINDVPARLLLDALDARGITVSTVTSLWHAVAAVWDPASPRGTPAREDVVAAHTTHAAGPITAIVMLDVDGRLVWCWSSGGSLLAGGSIRLPQDKSPETALSDPARPARAEAKPGIHVSAREAARLTTEWLAWAAQLGTAPSRVICIAPRSSESSPDLATFGESLAKAWPDAPVDLATSPDPLAETLTRLAERVDDAPKDASPVTPLPGLASRPARAHRRLLVFSSLAVAAVAMALGVWAYRLRAEAGEARAGALRVMDAWQNELRPIDPQLALRPDDAPFELQKRLDKLIADAKPKTTRGKSRPIMEELAVLSMVLGDPEIHLVDVQFNPADVTVRVQATLEEATAIAQALREVAGSRIATWSAPDARTAAQSGNTSGVFDFTIRGTWAEDNPATPAARTAAAEGTR
jgi:hypothetical protein